MIDKGIAMVTENGTSGLRILALMLIAGIMSSLKSNSVIRWQTLFEMKRKMAKKHLVCLVVILCTLYSIKEVRKTS